MVLKDNRQPSHAKTMQVSSSGPQKTLYSFKSSPYALVNSYTWGLEVCESMASNAD